MKIDQAIEFLNLLRLTKPSEDISLSVTRDDKDSEDMISHVKNLGYFCFVQTTVFGEEVVIVGKKT